MDNSTDFIDVEDAVVDDFSGPAELDFLSELSLPNGTVVDALKNIGICLAVWIVLYALAFVTSKFLHWKRSNSLDETLLTKPSLRMRCNHWMKSAPKSMFVDLTFSVLSLAFIVLEFVADNSAANVPWEWFLPEVVLASLFLLYFLFKLWLADSRCAYLRSFNALVDVFTVFPVYGSFLINRYAMLGFLRVFRLNEFFALTQRLPALSLTAKQRRGWLGRLVEFVSSGIMGQVLMLIFELLTIVLFSASLISILEQRGDFWELDDPERAMDPEMSVPVAIYFVFVTMSTVGYGDYSPVTTLGRVAVILLIIVALIVLPQRLGAIVDLIGARRIEIGSRKKVTGKNTVIVTGAITFKSVRDLFGGIFSPEKINAAQPSVVILSSIEPSAELKRLLTNPFYYKYVYFLQGSALSADDLNRVDAGNSKAVFILADPLTQATQEEDSQNILRLWSVRYQCSDVNVFIQLHHVEARERLLSLPRAYVNPAHVICLHDTKRSLMARAVQYPGISTLISNLFYRSSERVDASDTAKLQWIGDYDAGASNQVYVKKISPMFVGRSFHELANTVYEHWHVIALGLVVHCDGECDENGRDTYNVFLNPSSALRIGEKDRVLVLSDSERRADEISLPIESLVQRIEAPLPVAFQGLGIEVRDTSRKERLSKDEKRHRALQKRREKLAKKEREVAEEEAELAKKLRLKASGGAGKPTAAAANDGGDVAAADDVDGAAQSSEYEYSDESDDAEQADSDMLIVNGANNTLESIAARYRVPQSYFTASALAAAAAISRHVNNAADDEMSNDLDASASSSTARRSSQLVASRRLRTNGKGVTQRSVTVAKPRITKKSDHVIVIGCTHNLFSFVSPLRAKIVSEHRHVSILTPRELDSDEWEEVKMLPDIEVIIGSGENPHDLVRANVPQAYKVVIFAQPAWSLAKEDENFIDSKALFTALNVMAMCNYDASKIVLEVVRDSGLQFLDFRSCLHYEAMARTFTLREEKEIFSHCTAARFSSALFASGNAISTSFFDVLLSQCASNEYSFTVAALLIGSNEVYDPLQSQLILLDLPQHFYSEDHSAMGSNSPGDDGGGGDKDGDAAVVAAGSAADPESARAHRTLNYNFNDLFRFFLNECGAICLGLYRQSGVREQNKHPYVHTKPDSALRLAASDKCYCLVSLSYLQQVSAPNAPVLAARGGGILAGAAAAERANDDGDDDDSATLTRSSDDAQLDVPGADQSGSLLGSGQHQLATAHSGSGSGRGSVTVATTTKKKKSKPSRGSDAATELRTLGQASRSMTDIGEEEDGENDDDEEEEEEEEEATEDGENNVTGGKHSVTTTTIAKKRKIVKGKKKKASAKQSSTEMINLGEKVDLPPADESDDEVEEEEEEE